MIYDTLKKKISFQALNVSPLAGASSIRVRGLTPMSCVPMNESLPFSAYVSPSFQTGACALLCTDILCLVHIPGRAGECVEAMINSLYLYLLEPKVGIPVSNHQSRQLGGGPGFSTPALGTHTCCSLPPGDQSFCPHLVQTGGFQNPESPHREGI